MTSTQTFTAAPKGRQSHDPLPSGHRSLLTGLLELACVKTAAVRLAIIRFGEAGGSFEAGYRMSSQLVSALLPQLDFASPKSAVWTVVLGMKTYYCIIVNLTGLNATGRSMVALFEDVSSITEKTVGRLEGIFNAWWHMAGIHTGENAGTQGMVHVCSACQDVRVEGLGWMQWSDYLHRVMKIGISHSICDSCCGELYGELAARHPDSCPCKSPDECPSIRNGSAPPKGDGRVSPSECASILG